MSQQGLWIVCAVLIIVGFGGAWLKRNNGKFKESGTSESSGEALVFTEAELGQPLGSSLTVVQFSSTFCQPCVATKRVIARVLGQVSVEGIESIEINAEENLDLTRKASIMRTPTVMLLDPSGAVVSRASGELRPQQFIGALGEALGFDSSSVDVKI